MLNRLHRRIVVGFFLLVTGFVVIGQLSSAAEKKDNRIIKKKNGIPGYSSVKIDPERIQLLGLSTARVDVRDLVKKIRTVGIIQVDETRIAHIQTKFRGWIEDLYVDFVGIPVKKNQPLFKVYSQELFATQEEYLLALKDLDFPIGGRFAQQFKKASEDLLLSAQKRLELWDIPREQIEQLKKRKSATRTMLIRSPLDGIVLKKKAFIGMNVGPGINTYVLADLSYVWAFADIYEDDIAFIKMGQQAVLTVPALAGEKFYGKVTFIDYVVDPRTRTTKVRFEFDNSNYKLKPGMYTTVEIKLNMGKWLALPEEALIDTGLRKIVFVSLGKGRFEPREVTLGFKAGAFYQVLSGLSKADMVVTSSQFLIDSESRLKALEAGKMKGHGV